MKGNIPRFLRLALVVILAVSFSLVPGAVNPKPAAAAEATITAASVSATVTPSTAGRNAKYVIKATATAVVAIGDTITIVFPSGTTNGTAANVGDLNTVVAGAVTMTGSPAITATIVTAAWTVASRTLVITTATAAIAAATVLTITINKQATGSGAAIINPGTAGLVTLTVSGVTSSNYAIGNDIGIVAGGTSYRASATVKPNVTMVRVGDVLTIKSLKGTVEQDWGGDTAADYGNALDSAGATAEEGDFVAGSLVELKIDGVLQTANPANATVGSESDKAGAYRKFVITWTVDPREGSAQKKKSTATGKDFLGEVKVGGVTIQFAIWVVPKALFTPSSGGAGATVTISGTGFAKSKGITLLSSLNPMLTTAQTAAAAPVASGAYATATSFSTGVNTDSTGSFSATFPAVGGANKTQYIGVKDGEGNLALDIVYKADETDNTFALLPSITLSPKTGKPGDTVTISGSNYDPTAGTNVRVWFDVAVISGATGYGQGGHELTGNLNATTGFYALDGGQLRGLNFKVPAGKLPGDYTVTVKDASGNATTGTFTVVSLPLTLNPTTAPRYGKVTISVSNMSPSDNVAANNLTLGNVAWNTAVTATSNTEFVSGFKNPGGGDYSFDTDASGGVTVTIRVRSDASIGSNVVKVVDSKGRIAQGTLTVTVPSLSVSPAESVKSQTVTVVGKGWVPDQSVNVTVNTPTTTTFSAVPDAAGNFSGTFTVSTSAMAGSTYTIDANDGNNRGNTAASATMKIKDVGIKVSPAVVKWGDTVTITGSGFKGGSQMKYGLPWKTVVLSSSFPAVTYTNSVGEFTATLLVPTVEKGVQSLGVTDDDGVSATATIEVQEAPRTAATALAPIAAQLVRVWGFDGATQSWKLYDPAVPAELNTLPALSRGSGYFINVNAATTITTGGVTISLYPGWNNIGWLD